MKKTQQFTSVFTRYSLILVFFALFFGIFYVYDSFNITSAWFKNDELEARTSDPNQNQDDSQTKNVPVSIQLSGNILPTIPINSLTNIISSSGDNENQINTLIGSVDCTNADSEIACDSLTISSKLPNFSSIEILNSPAKSLSSLQNVIPDSSKKSQIFIQDKNESCTTILLSSQIIFAKKIERKESPFAYCSINPSNGNNLDQIKRFGDYMPMFIVINEESTTIEQPLVDMLIKLQPDLVIIKSSSNISNLNWKNIPTHQIPLTYLDLSNSPAIQFTIQFAKDSSSSKYFDETSSCTPIPESCLTLIQKNMIKKPSIQIKSQIVSFSLTNT